MACEYDAFLLCHRSRHLGLERRAVEQASEGGHEGGAGARGDAAPDAAERREERGVDLRVPERRAAAGVGEGGHPAGGGPGGREDEGRARVRVGRVVHLEGGGGGGGRGAAARGEGELGAVGDEQAVVVGERRRARGRSVHRHRGEPVGPTARGRWRSLPGGLVADASRAFAVAAA